MCTPCILTIVACVMIPVTIDSRDSKASSDSWAVANCTIDKTYTSTCSFMEECGDWFLSKKCTRTRVESVAVTSPSFSEYGLNGSPRMATLCGPGHGGCSESAGSQELLDIIQSMNIAECWCLP